MKKKFFEFLMMALIGYILCTESFATTDTISLSCGLGTSLSKNITIGAGSNITVNWGDDTIEQVPVALTNSYGETVLTHTYYETNRYNISITAEDIQKVEANSNDILSINVSNAASIKVLKISNNKISSLDLTNNLDLEELLCENNKLEQLKVWSTNIRNLNCSGNKLATLDVPNSVTELYVNNNNLSTLDLSSFSNLVVLECADNSIESLSIGPNSLLEKLDFTNNSISSISLNSSTNLKELYCSNNEIENLNLSNNVSLERVDCTYNKLKTLNLNNNTALKELYVFENLGISSINLNNLNLELIVVDKTVSLTNNNANVVIKLDIDGDGGVIVGNNKNLILSTDPYGVYLDEERIVLEENVLDLRGYSGTKEIFIQFYVLMVNQDFGVNEPQLLEGMIPVKYNGTNWVITNIRDSGWYNYKDGRWANVMLRDGARYLDVDGTTLNDIGSTHLDNLIGREVPEAYTGSMYVWIPRYSFKIENNKVKTKYSSGLVDYTDDGYILHPAFNYTKYKGGDTSDSINYEGLTSQDKYLGMWVAKYPAGNASVPKYASNVEETRDFSIGEAFLKSKLTGTSASYGLQGGTSHMIKNTEWGAVAYLTSSIGDVKSESTTGNIYGIYNLNNNPEYVSTFIELVGGVSNYNVRENGKSLIPYIMLKYLYNPITNSKDIDSIRLRKAQDNGGLNYNVFSKYYGIAMNEVDTNISGAVTKTIPYERDAFLVRGIDGIYSYSNSTGASNGNAGFRNVIFGNGINNNDNSEYFTITAMSNYGGKISPYGSITVKAGKNVIYSIKPNTGYQIADVIVDGVSEYYNNSNYTNYGTYATYTFNNINSNHEIYVEFDDQIAPYNVSVRKYVVGVGESAGVATIEGEGTHNSRTIVTIKPTPIMGYRVLNWEIPSDLENVQVSITEGLSFKMPSRDVEIKINFEQVLDAPLTVENMYSSINVTKDVGSSVSLTAGVFDGYKFGNWEAEGLELTEEQRKSPSIEFTMPANAVRLVAKYNKLSPVNLILGDGTLVEFEGEETKNITFLAPETSSNKNFSAWKIDGYVYLDLGRSIQLTMPDKTINIEAIY